MYKICQTEHSTRRQREMEQGLLQMMLHRDYADISVRELCEQLKIPRKSFYRYFSNKDDALYSLIDHKLADFFQMPLPGKKSRGSGIGDLDLFFFYWYNNKPFLDALQRSSLSGILVERAKTFALQEGFLLQKVKSISEQAQEIVMTFTVCGLMSMTLAWHLQGFLFSPDEMTHLALNMFTTPLLTQKDRR